MRRATRRQLYKKYNKPSDPILEVGENKRGWYVKIQSGTLIMQVKNGIYPITPATVPVLERSRIYKSKWF